VLKFLWVASAVWAESVILSVGSAESMMLSAGAKCMIVSAPPAESMILTVLFDCVITLKHATSSAAGSNKKITIGNTDNCQLTTLVNSASMLPLIGLPPKGAKFFHTSNRLLLGH
jgi:hypothetical protein